MIVVIQCAGSKREGARSMETKVGRQVSFVAHPELAPRGSDRLYARPDDHDPSDQGGPSWRERLLTYNESPNDNHLGLLPAFELYKNDIYRDLVARFRVENCYILSAGWGLINAAFRTPSYDITFGAAAENFVRRRKEDSYRDFCMLPDDTEGPVIFFGSKEYVPLFAALTRSVKSRKKVFYNARQPPAAPGCVLKRFETRTRINWQYECAKAFLKGDILCA
jgi:hypothetical protein